MYSLNTHKKDKIIQEYFFRYPLYFRLAENIKEALENLLNEKNIGVVSIHYRIKSLEQVLQKIERKKYTDPLNQMTDICGLRLVCYFQSDVSKIINVIRNNFEVVESNNKTQDLPPSQFGYRSSHLVIKIKDSWKNTPNYRGLENIKAEVQIRTILMHAWAEIEHKLAYKKTEHIPKQIRRKFSRISALLEEADERFEEIYRDIRIRKEETKKKLEKNSAYAKKINLDLDNLQAFLDFYFPNKEKNIKKTRDFLDELINSKITLKDLIKSMERKDVDKGIEEEENQTESAKRLLR